MKAKLYSDNGELIDTITANKYTHFGYNLIAFIKDPVQLKDVIRGMPMEPFLITNLTFIIENNVRETEPFFTNKPFEATLYTCNGTVIKQWENCCDMLFIAPNVYAFYDINSKNWVDVCGKITFINKENKENNED